MSWWNNERRWWSSWRRVLIAHTTSIELDNYNFEIFRKTISPKKMYNDTDWKYKIVKIGLYLTVVTDLLRPPRIREKIRQSKSEIVRTESPPVSGESGMMDLDDLGFWVGLLSILFLQTIRERLNILKWERFEKRYQIFQTLSDV